MGSEAQRAKGAAQDGEKRDDRHDSLSLWLLVEHRVEGMFHSLYKIELPSDLDQQDQPDDDDKEEEDWPTLNPVEETSSGKISMMMIREQLFLYKPEMVELGRKIYFLGGISDGASVKSDLLTTVRVLDADDASKLKTVKSMNHPKHKPCVFVADGKIYAFGSPLYRVLKGGASGNFERYLPEHDVWEVLPDPHLRMSLDPDLAKWPGHATVVGRKVFIGCTLSLCYIHLLVFNLDTLEWEDSAAAPPSFPYGALLVDKYLYHIRGGAELWRWSNVLDQGHQKDPLQIVKRGPIPIDNDSYSYDDLKEVLANKAYTVATAGELESENERCFTHTNFRPFRQLHHLGGPFFCVLITSQNVDRDGYTNIQDYHARGLVIKIFKEVEDQEFDHGAHASKFCLVGSLCYKFRTPLRHVTRHVRCSVIGGSVPASWYEVPLKRKESDMWTKKGVIKAGETNGYVHKAGETNGYAHNFVGVHELSKMTSEVLAIEAADKTTGYGH